MRWDVVVSKLGRTSVLRDETPPIPPGPEGSNGNGPSPAQWAPGVRLFLFLKAAATDAAPAAGAGGSRRPGNPKMKSVFLWDCEMRSCAILRLAVSGVGRSLSYRETAMRREGFQEAGRSMAAEGIAAEGALNELEKQESEWIRLRQSDIVPRDIVAEDRVIRGLRVAVPISLALWMVIGALLWALTR